MAFVAFLSLLLLYVFGAAAPPLHKHTHSALRALVSRVRYLEYRERRSVGLERPSRLKKKKRKGVVRLDDVSSRSPLKLTALGFLRSGGGRAGLAGVEGVVEREPGLGLGLNDEALHRFLGVVFLYGSTHRDVDGKKG